MTLIQPVLKGAALKADIAATDAGDGVVVWWLGQSGFLVKSAVGTVLFDPYLSDSLTRKYAATDKQHIRMTELVIAPDQLTDIDVVTSTHNHTDHLDADTLIPLFGANPDLSLVIPTANCDFVADRLGCKVDWPVGLNDGESTKINGIEIHAVLAAHDEIDRDENGYSRYLGYVIRLGNKTIYHSGDTRMYKSMVDGLRPFRIDVAILPINGHKPERRVSGNLFGDEAAHLAHDIGARVVIPCHYDMFTFNTETPELFSHTCETLNQPYRVLQCGERVAI